MPAGCRSHSARSTARPSACAADLGTERIRAASPRRGSPGRPASRAARTLGDARGDIGRHHRGGDEEDDDRVDFAVGDDRRKGIGVRLGSRRAEYVDGAGEGPLRGTTEASSSRVSAPRLTSSSPAASQASAQRIPEPACVGDDRDAPSRGSGWVERIAATSTSSSTVRSDDAGLPEERRDCGLRPREGGRVRARPWRQRGRPRSSLRERGFCREILRATCRTFEGCRTTRDRGGRRRWPDPPPRTPRGGRSRTRPPCCRSKRTPRIRAPGSRSARVARARGRRSVRRRRFVRAGRPSAKRGVQPWTAAATEAVRR